MWMHIDGHFAQWGVKRQSAVLAMKTVLDQFVDGIASVAWLKTQKLMRK
jgi:hypothetical protein